MCACVYLKRSNAELDAEAQVNIDVVGQKIEEHVMSAEQWDEEESGLSQASNAQTERSHTAAYLSQLNGASGNVWRRIFI